MDVEKKRNDVGHEPQTVGFPVYILLTSLNSIRG